MNLEAVGLAPGESVPPPILQPPSLFPTLTHQPLQLDLIVPEVASYLVTKKQELKLHMSQSPFHLQTDGSVSGQRKSFKSKLSCGRNSRGTKGGIGWNIEWTFFPKELRPKVKLKKKTMKTKKQTQSLPQIGTVRKKRKRCISDVACSDGGGSSGDAVKAKKSRRVTFEDDGEDEGVLEKKLEKLEKKEQLSGDSEQSGGEEMMEEVYDEEEEEEGTDYSHAYFDNGEDYDGGDDDALDDGPIY